MPISYPLDLSGVNPTNLVRDELHTVNEAHFRDYSFIVPNFAPFFIDNFKATLTVNGVSRTLVEDVDYSFALSYVTGTRTTGKAMYGAITVHNLNLNGLITIDYQTVGGDQVADRLEVLTVLADKAYNPRTTIWELLTNVPNALPPTPHYQDYDSFYGQEELVNMLGGIRDAILTNSSLTRDEIQKFLESLNSIEVSSFVRKQGDRMQGPFLLARDPLENNEATTKLYVDSRFLSKEALNAALSQYLTADATNTALAQKLGLSGGTMSGFITLNAPPQADMHPANKTYVDDKVKVVSDAVDVLRTEVQTMASGNITRDEVMKLIGELSVKSSLLPEY